MNRKRRTVYTCGECGRGYTSLADAQGHEARCKAVAKSSALPSRVVRYRWSWDEQALVPVMVKEVMR